MSTNPVHSRHGYFLHEITVGMSADYSKTFTQEDVIAFSRLSGDDNPLHLDDDFAASTRFLTPIIHGMLTTSLWSTVVGTLLPGPGCAYMGQNTRFLKPVRVGQSVTGKLTVRELVPEKQRVIFETEAFADGDLVAAGEAITWVPRKPAS